MKKILIIVTKGEMGGAQEVVLSLARGLYARGHMVSVAWGEGEYLAQELLGSGIEAIRFKHLRRTHNPFQNILFEREVRIFLDMHSYEVVHIHSSNALFAARGAKRAKYPPKTIYTFHGMSFLAPEHSSAPVRFLYARIYAFLLKFVDVPVCVCEHDRTVALAHGLFKTGLVVPVGITPLAPRIRDDARRVLVEKIFAEYPHMRVSQSPLSEKIFIGSVGRLAYPKRYNFFISGVSEILRASSSFIAVVIGSGPDLKKYKRLIDKQKIADKFFFVSSYPHASELLSAFDVFVLTSLYEGMPLTLLEAMSAKLPVLVPGVGGIPEVLLSHKDQLYDVHSQGEFAAKLRLLLDDSSMRNKCGAWNKKRSEVFDSARMVDRYEAIF